MDTSDKDPVFSIEQVIKISQSLKNGQLPRKFLPIDTHIIEYSELIRIIKTVPRELAEGKEKEAIPFLPIAPRSYRKDWQYDDEAYNFIFDYIASFTPFGIDKELQELIDETRKEIVTNYDNEDLFDTIIKAGRKSTERRFKTIELKERFFDRMNEWRKIKSKEIDIEH